MANTFEGKRIGTGLRIGVVVARFNDFITNQLLSGATSTLEGQGVASDDITVAWVPGAFELPLVASKLAMSGKFDAVITLGCVIRGATTHYDYVCNEAAKGIAAAGQKSGIPVIFGVVTTENIEQAIERAGCKAGNKGADAAVAAVEMASLLKNLRNENLILA